MNSLILNANDLLGVLVERRQAIVDLLANTSAVSQQLVGLVADNEKELAPTLEQLNKVNEVLVRNRDNLAKAIPGAAKYQTTLSEAVSSGFYYTAYVPNFQPWQLFQPFLDYAFGFRRARSVMANRTSQGWTTGRTPAALQRDSRRVAVMRDVSQVAGARSGRRVRARTHRRRFRGAARCVLRRRRRSPRSFHPLRRSTRATTCASPVSRSAPSTRSSRRAPRPR